MKPDVFIGNKEIQEVIGCKATKAWKLISQLNEELSKKGYITVKGRVPRRYFMERLGITEATKA